MRLRKNLVWGLLTIGSMLTTPAFAMSAKEAAQDSNRLGIGVYQELARENDLHGKNLLVSPISLSAALDLAMAGASGETLAELQSFLASQATSFLDSIEGTSELLQKLNYKEEGIELSLANSLWARPDLSLRSDYVSTLQEKYHAEARTLDFRLPQAASTINSWVADKTRNRIREIVDQGFLQTLVMTLINATYFKADWMSPFITDETASRPFHLLNGSTKEVPFLQHRVTRSYKYLNDGSFEVLELPYKSKASMLILLPHQTVSLAEAERSLQNEMSTILQSLESTNPQYGKVALPKFTFDDGHYLKSPLRNLGLNSIFSGRADFSGISEEGLSVSEIIQKTFIAVNEKGTEAAAVTAIGIRTTSLPPRETFHMVVDRPFLFVIKDNETNAILFLGRVADPK